MKKILLYEAFPTVLAEPSYASDIFRIRYRSNNDLSNKRGNDTIDKPVNDLLDDFAVGDVVSGEDRDGNAHTGRVLRIDKDSDGENLSIFVEEDGKQVKIMPATVRMDSEVGNQKKVGPESVNTNPMDRMDPTPGSTMESNNKKMKNLKAFGSFLNESNGSDIGEWKELGPNWLFDYVMGQAGSSLYHGNNLIMPHSELDISIVFFIPRTNAESSNRIRWTWTWGADGDDVESMIAYEMKNNQTLSANITGDSPKEFVKAVDKYISETEKAKD